MDKSWMRLSRVSDGYLAGVDSFLDFAFSHTPNPRIPCPCVKCKNRLYQKRDEVRIHMVVHGIIPHYDVWILHGEPYIPRGEQNQLEVPKLELGDDIHGLIVRENTNEDGASSLDTREIGAHVIGQGTKGTQRMIGKPVPKSKEKPLTQVDVERIQRHALEDARREIDGKLEAIRSEFDANFEARFQTLLPQSQTQPELSRDSPNPRHSPS